MQLCEYTALIQRVPFGKRLPTAVYVYRDPQITFDPQLELLLNRLAQISGAGPEYNVVKFRADEPKISFLSYPDFLGSPHPILRHAVTVDLITGKWRKTDYTNNINPPILHRK